MRKILIAACALAALSSSALAQGVANCKVSTAAPSYTNGTVQPQSCDTSGNLRTSTAAPSEQNVNLNQILGAAPSLTNPLWVFPATGATFPVSGTFWQATQPVSGTFWQATQPVSAASLPLPTGAATAANQTTWQAATDAAVPANAVYNGANVGGNLTGNIACGSSKVYDASTSGSTELVALSGSTVIYVCGYSILAAGTVNVELDTGHGTACATGNAKITPAYQLTAQAGLVDGSPVFRGLKTVAGDALCLKTSGGIAVQAVVYYTQF